MANSKEHWQRLYALQDAAARVLLGVDHAFYLTGGTALSRGYFGHRYSEDLDYFVNDRPEFSLWRERCIDTLAHAGAGRWTLEVVRRDERFGRLVLHGDVDLKMEFINDVPSRCGAVAAHPLFGWLDTRENILANKITALLDRAAPKDVADIYWLCCRAGISLLAALEGAAGKAAGIFPPLVAKRLQDVIARGVPDVIWCDTMRPTDATFAHDMQTLISSLIE
jgi:hypothetical protein